jgi:prepilin signal peptidase PulO-like enzyme (type II secretory pathway)
LKLTVTPFLGEALIAAILGFLLFFLIRIFTKGLGLGDVKYSFFIGLFCGLEGCSIAFFTAALSGLIVAGILILTKKMDSTKPIPFAPFLSFGALTAKTILLSGFLQRILQ